MTLVNPLGYESYTPEKKLEDLQQYYDQLNRHDWFYAYSDDHGVWTKGRNEESRLIAATNRSPAHFSLYSAFRASVASGIPRPERPTVLDTQPA